MQIKLNNNMSQLSKLQWASPPSFKVEVSDAPVTQIFPVLVEFLHGADDLAVTCDETVVLQVALCLGFVEKVPQVGVLQRVVLRRHRIA